MKKLVIILLLFTAFVISANAQVVVIVNKSSSINAIDVAKLISIYNLNTKSWDSGVKIFPANLKTGDSKDGFFASMKTSEAELRKVWMKKKLTDGSEVPTLVENEDEMINFVKSKTGAIGFISKAKLTDDVKAVLTIK